MTKMFTRKEVVSLAHEVAGMSHDRVETIVFADGSISQITGSWEAQKPVWACFQGGLTPNEAFRALMEACTDEDGIPYTPK